MRILLSILFISALGICPLGADEIEKQYFDFIVEGKKTIEGRVNMPDIAKLKKGDMISFKDEEDREVICKVTTVF